MVTRLLLLRSKDARCLLGGRRAATGLLLHLTDGPGGGSALKGLLFYLEPCECSRDKWTRVGLGQGPPLWSWSWTDTKAWRPRAAPVGPAVERTLSPHACSGSEGPSAFRTAWPQGSSLLLCTSLRPKALCLHTCHTPSGEQPCQESSGLDPWP